jgi:hypothetical protein
MPAPRVDSVFKRRNDKSEHGITGQRTHFHRLVATSSSY